MGGFARRGVLRNRHLVTHMELALARGQGGRSTLCFFRIGLTVSAPGAHQNIPRDAHIGDSSLMEHPVRAVRATRGGHCEDPRRITATKLRYVLRSPEPSVATQGTFPKHLISGLHWNSLCSDVMTGRRMTTVFPFLCSSMALFCHAVYPFPSFFE